MHFGEIYDDRKDSTAPHITFRPQLGGHRQCGLAICTFHLGFSLGLIASAGVEVWPLEEADVALARQLYEQYPALQARDLCHLSSCRRRGVREIKTFDQTFAGISALIFNEAYTSKTVSWTGEIIHNLGGRKTVKSSE